MISKTNSKTDVLKILACLLMVIDHIGFCYGNVYMRIIGRLSFPIFAYYLVLGNQRTSNKKRYLLRLFVFAIISQMPYMYFFNTYNLNIFFTLQSGLLIINVRFKKDVFTYAVKGILIIVLSLIPLDYGVYGLITIVLFDELRDKKALLIMFTVATILYSFYYGSLVQMFSILALPLILNVKRLEYVLQLRINKYIYYFFYPVHLLVLIGITR